MFVLCVGVGVALTISYPLKWWMKKKSRFFMFTVDKYCLINWKYLNCLAMLLLLSFSEISFSYFSCSRFFMSCAVEENWLSNLFKYLLQCPWVGEENYDKAKGMMGKGWMKNNLKHFHNILLTILVTGIPSK